jgi:hypothetical protein
MHRKMPDQSLELIRLCPVHPGKSGFLPLKSQRQCRSLDSLRSLGMTEVARSG